MLLQLPLDLINPILHHLRDRDDLLACTRVNRNFHQAALPLFYAFLDARLLRKRPSPALLEHPHLAKHVRCLTEHGALTPETLCAIASCTNLISLSWIDDIPTPSPGSGSPTSNGATERNPEAETLALIAVTKTLTQLRSLTLRTYNDLSPEAWGELASLSGLTKLSLWCFASPNSSKLDGPLAATLTQLELCVGSIGGSECVSLLSGLPGLEELRLKGAPSDIMPTILSLLPHLHTLDIDFVARPSENAMSNGCSLRNLTVRANSCSPVGLYEWIAHLLVQNTLLESFTLYAFIVRAGHVIPRAFVRRLPPTLMQFVVGEAELALWDVAFLCESMPKLERVECLVEAGSLSAIKAAVASGRKLKKVKFRVRWTGYAEKLSLGEAREWMLAYEQLRAVGVNAASFTGKWVFNGGQEFVVDANIEGNRWGT